GAGANVTMNGNGNVVRIGDISYLYVNGHGNNATAGNRSALIVTSSDNYLVTGQYSGYHFDSYATEASAIQSGGVHAGYGTQFFVGSAYVFQTTGM
ncbi:MAG: hypothetical protein E6848_00980, partial [Bradyrhizobium sp.]|nr:hypothetical protein [Bradyrhizobium sp.]